MFTYPPPLPAIHPSVNKGEGEHASQNNEDFISFHPPPRLYYSASYCHLAYPPLPSVYPPSQKLLYISSHPDIPSTTSSFAHPTSLSFTPSSHPTANLPTLQFLMPTLLITNFTFVNFTSQTSSWYSLNYLRLSPHPTVNLPTAPSYKLLFSSRISSTNSSFGYQTSFQINFLDIQITDNPWKSVNHVKCQFTSQNILKLDQEWSTDQSKFRHLK